MPSVIVLTTALTDLANIHPNDEPALLAGMQMFGDRYKATYDSTSAQTAAETIKECFTYVINQGCYVYYFSNYLSQFIRLTAPVRNGIDINFTEAVGGNFSIQVHLDTSGPNTLMNLAAPIGNHTMYLDLFNKLAAQDWKQNQDTDFFAASILISRCK
jgi:hypothetical protein